MRWRLLLGGPYTRRARSVVGSRMFAQAAVFTGSNLAVSALGALSTTILARGLAPTAYGNFSFAVSTLTFAAMFFEFGLFLPAARLAARTEGGRAKRSVIGASFAVYLPIGVAFAAVVFALSFVIDSIFAVNVGHAFRLVAPLALAYPFLNVSQQIAQGVDRLHVSSISRVTAQVVFVFPLALLTLASGSVSVTQAITLRSASYVVGGLVLVVWLRPLFHGVEAHVRVFLADARRYGIQVYIGRVFSIGTYNMDVLMLAGFADAQSVGIYSFAGCIAYASGLPIVGLATALFPRLTQRAYLERRWVIIASAAGAAIALVAWLLAAPFIDLVFASSYAGAGALVLPLAAAQALRGVTTVYNTFLAAQARGTALRNNAIVLVVGNVIFNFALIPPFGADGAAWASFLALLGNLAAHIVSYRRAVGVFWGAPARGF